MQTALVTSAGHRALTLSQILSMVARFLCCLIALNCSPRQPLREGLSWNFKATGMTILLTHATRDIASHHRHQFVLPRLRLRLWRIRLRRCHFEVRAKSPSLDSG